MFPRSLLSPSVPEPTTPSDPDPRLRTVTAALATTGYVVLAADPRDPSAFWPALAAHLDLHMLAHPHRPEGRVARDPATIVDFHADLGRTPYRPEVLALLIEQVDGGVGRYDLVDTCGTVGAELRAVLPPSLRYDFRLDARAVLDARPGQSPAAFANTSIGRLVSARQPSPESVEVRFDVDVAQTSRFAGVPTVPVSLLGPYSNIPRDPDGEPITDERRDRVRAILCSAAVRLDVPEGAMLVIDNARILHGRGPWTGARRVSSVMLGTARTPFG